MATSSYRTALKRILVHEGGKVNHPKDPGGRTNMGVTQRVYDAYRKNRNLAQRTVYDIQMSEVEAIYAKGYWDKVRGDDLPAGVDYTVFDGAVNSGPSRSVVWLQQSLPAYKGPLDGMIGEATVQAAKAHPDHDQLVLDILEKREAFLRNLTTFKTFGRGWMNRLEEVEHGGTAMASGSIPAPAKFHVGGNALGLMSDGELNSAPASSAATAGLVSLAVAVALSQLAPISSDQYVRYFMIGLVMFGFVSTVAAGWFRNTFKRRAKALGVSI